MENKRVLMLSILVLIALFSLDLVSIVISVKSHNQLEESKSENVSDIGENWRRGPIIEFSSNCMSPFTQLSDSPWDGSVKGCQSSGTTFRGTCSSQQNSGAGKEISEQPPVPIVLWKDIVLCGKTLGSYFDLTIVESECPSETKKCGKIDSLGNILCVPQFVDCPVTSIYFADSPSENSIKGNKTYLNYSKEPTNSDIPVQFKISEGKICSDLAYRQYSREPHILETFALKSKCSNELANTLENPYFTELDVSLASNIYRENNIRHYLANLPSFDFISLNTPIYLNSRSYIGIKPSCIERLKEIEGLTDKLISLDEEVSEMDNFTFLVKTLTLIFCPISMVLCLISFTLTCTRKIFLRGSAVLGTFVLLLQTALMVLNIIAKSYLDDIQSGIGFIAQENCSDPIANESIRLFDSILLESVDYYNFVWVFNLLHMCGFSLSYLAFWFILE